MQLCLTLYRESNIGICDSNGCSSGKSHFVHILGCKERPWLQFSGAIPVWCYHGAYGICLYSGINLHFETGFFPFCFLLGISFLSLHFCLEGLRNGIPVQILFPLGRLSLMIYGCLASIIFCGYIIYDTDNLIKRYSYDEYIWAAVSLYLDIINLFLALLTIFRASE